MIELFQLWHVVSVHLRLNIESIRYDPFGHSYYLVIRHPERQAKHLQRRTCGVDAIRSDDDFELVGQRFIGLDPSYRNISKLQLFGIFSRVIGSDLSCVYDTERNRDRE